MICPHCDHKNEEGIRFCTGCGELLSKRVRRRSAERPEKIQPPKTTGKIPTTKWKKIFLLCFAVFVILGLGVTLFCKLKNQIPQKKILGKWIHSDGRETWEFLKNGTIKRYEYVFDTLANDECKYEINDREHITIRRNDFLKKYKFSIYGDELVLEWMFDKNEPMQVKLKRLGKIKPEVIREAKKTACCDNLKQIGLALHMWAGDHGEKFPESLADLSPYVANGDLFRCPGDNRYKEIIKELKKDTSLSYDYVKGLTPDANDRIIVYDSLKENHGDGRNVLFVFGNVKYLQEKEFQEILK